jgi:hypothetical protein
MLDVWRDVCWRIRTTKIGNLHGVFKEEMKINQWVLK